MHQWYFSFNSVIFLTAFLLGVFLSAFMLFIKKKARHTWLLATYFGFFSLMVFSGLVVLSVPLDHLFFSLVMVSSFCLLAPFLMQFAYHFPHNFHPLESRLMLVFWSLVVIASIWTFNVSIHFDGFGFITHFSDLAHPMALIIMTQVIAGLWTILIWIRKILRLEKNSTAPLWKKLIRPSNRYARAMRSFILVFSLATLLPISDVLQVKGIISQEQQYSVLVALGILIFALFFTVYINQFPERSNLMSKLLGACLLLVLPFLIREGYRVDRLNRALWHQQCLDELYAYEAHLKHNNHWEPSPRLRYILSYRQNDEPEDHRLEFSPDEGRELAWFSGFDRAFHARQRMLVEHFQARPRPQPLYRFLQRNGDRDALAFTDYPIHYDFVFQGRRYEMGYSYLDFRKALAPINLGLARVQVSAILVAFLFFPIVFRRTLVRPLKALIDGVRLAKSGDLKVEVPVYARDEIGFLARSFNEMVTSFREAQVRLARESAARMKLAEENARKDQELEQARLLQLAMLPKTLPNTPDLEIAVFMRPATEVGGDYYDFREGDDGALIVGVGDATGHGLQAGTMVAATKSLFNATVDRREPLTFLADTSKALAEMGYENMYMALMIAHIQKGRVRITSAGMPYATLFRAQSRTIERVRLPGLPLGSTFSFPYQLHQLVMAPDDVLLLQSDGLEERFSENNEIFGEDRVNAVFAEHAHLDAETIVRLLVEAGESWGGARPQDDDITLLVLKRTSAA